MGPHGVAVLLLVGAPTATTTRGQGRGRFGRCFCDFVLIGVGEERKMGIWMEIDINLGWGIRLHGLGIRLHGAHVS